MAGGPVVIRAQYWLWTHMKPSNSRVVTSAIGVTDGHEEPLVAANSDFARDTHTFRSRAMGSSVGVCVAARPVDPA